MRSVGNLLKKHWRALLLALGIAVASYFILFHNLANLTPNYSATEIATQGSATSLKSIWEDPINAPFKLLVWLPFKLGHHSVLWTRVAAGLIATISAVLFYFILEHLFSRRVALCATLMFVFSTGFLHAGHLGSPLIMQIFGITLLIASVPLYAKTRLEVTPIYLGVIAGALLLYTPTMPWFIIIGAIIMAKEMRAIFARLDVRHKILLPLLFIILVSPLIWSLIRDPASGLTLLGLPRQIPSLHSMGSHLFSFAKSLVWHGTGPAEIMLIGAPIFNVIEAGLITAGIVTLVRSIKLRSNLFIGGSVILFILLVVFGGTTYLPIVPLLYLLLASGIFYLLNEWFEIFPLNPVANVIGTAAICLIVGTSVLFHARSFFVAWPHSDETHEAFSHPQPVSYFPDDIDADGTVRF